MINHWDAFPKLLNVVLESSFDGIYIADGDANTLFVNTAYEKITGLNRELVIGKNLRDIVKEGLISISGTVLVLEHRQPITLEQKFNTGKHAIITSTPTFNDAGEIIMVFTNVRDITEIHSLRKKLRQEEGLSQLRLAEMEIIRKQIIGTSNMVAVDPSMLNVVVMASKVARMETAVLLLGETGVGKEMLASYIHQNSSRSGQRLLKINCAAIPSGLAESELFGYEGSAFTGARKEGKPGLFEIADKGTVFLDEVGELSLDLQVKLLRVLQEKEIQRIGGGLPRKVDVRIIAATNRNLEEMIQQGIFRKDLFYRLSVFPITLPPLRNRPGDIQPLSKAILDELNRQNLTHKEISTAAVMELESYDWPGNVRELRNVLERAMILCANDVIEPWDLAIRTSSRGSVHIAHLPNHPIDLKKILEDMEAQYIHLAYKKHKNVRSAANALLMDATTYQRKKKKYKSEP